jgi:hypothetical protein
MRATARTATFPRHVGAMAQRISMSFLMVAGLAYLLQDRVMALDFGLAVQALGGVRADQWFGSCVAAVISFWAVGQYDAVVHRHLATGVPVAEARRAGIAAIAISQTAGAGVVTGAFVRWRMLRGTTLWQATRISVAVTISFLAGWAVVTGAVLSVFGYGMWQQIGLAGLLAGGVVFGLGLWQPHLLLRLKLPNAMTQGRLIGLTLLDTCAAGLTLYLLLPVGLDLPFPVLLPGLPLARRAVSGHSKWPCWPCCRMCPRPRSCLPSWGGGWFTLLFRRCWACFWPPTGLRLRRVASTLSCVSPHHSARAASFANRCGPKRALCGKDICRSWKAGWGPHGLQAGPGTR